MQRTDDSRLAVLRSPGPTVGTGRSPSRAGSVLAVIRRRDHEAQARLLRQLLVAFPAEDDNTADRRVRRRVEGAIIASELAAADAHPAPVVEPDEGPPPSAE